MGPRPGDLPSVNNGKENGNYYNRVYIRVIIGARQGLYKNNGKNMEAVVMGVV